MIRSLKDVVTKQRRYLEETLGVILSDLACRLAPNMDDRQRLETILRDDCDKLKDCKYLYVLDDIGIQITGNRTFVWHIQDALISGGQSFRLK